MRYETDLTHEQWELVEPFMRQKSGPSAKRDVSTREAANVPDAIGGGEVLACGPRGQPFDHEGTR